MKKIAILTVAAVVVVAGSAAALSDGGLRRIRLALNGLKEVPVIATTGKGVFTASVNKDATEIKYTLRYSNLEGTVTQSHIHVGPPQNTGGISVWLCSNLASPPTPAGVQACPAPGGQIEGVITAADVVGPVAQGYDPGDWNDLLAAIRDGKTYVNVHSSKFPAGEIRSQISAHDDDHGRH
jgi:hypothetical protein